MLPRVLIAATKSGCGKSLITSLIIYRLINECKMNPAVFKCGPDYLDPLFLSRVFDINTGNLDSYFYEKETLNSIILSESKGADIAVIEGVMGYYDGLDTDMSASTSEVAEYTDTPVILVADGRGRMQSVLAEIYGFIHFHPYGSRIKGVILNRTSDKVCHRLSPEIEKMGLRVLGVMPDTREAELSSRYLGLSVLEDGRTAFNQIASLSDKLSLDMHAVIKIAGSGSDTENLSEDFKPDFHGRYEGLRVAIAKDEAFLFLYRENIAALKAAGVEILYFSPLHDKRIPKCEGIILCGGYPEDYAEELSANKGMLESVREATNTGLPIIAECGGFLYLHKTLTTKDGREYPMAGVIDGKCFYKGFNTRFGYELITLKGNSLLGKENDTFKAHEFHYYESDSIGSDAVAVKPNDKSTCFESGHLTESMYAGFSHIPFMGNGSVLKNYLESVREYDRAGNRSGGKR